VRSIRVALPLWRARCWGCGLIVIIGGDTDTRVDVFRSWALLRCCVDVGVVVIVAVCSYIVCGKDSGGMGGDCIKPTRDVRGKPDI
jgi:hypothetical protein